MGLDWMLANHAARPGCEREYNRIKNKLERLEFKETSTEEQRQAMLRELKTEFESVSITPYELIGAPRVGINAEATVWFRRNCYEPAQKAIQHERLLPVAEGMPALVQPLMRNEGFIAYWSRPFETVLADVQGQYVVQLAQDQRGLAAITGIATGALDFRGEVVGSSEVLPGQVRSEAYEEHDGEQSVRFGQKIEDALHDLKDEQLPHVVELRHAVRWLRFWGERGFGFSPWY